MVVSAEQALHDTAVIHRVGLGRYSNAVVRRVISLMNRTDLDVVARLSRGDFDGRDTHSRAELERLLADIRVMQADGWKTIARDFDVEVEALASAEMEFGHRLVQMGAQSVGFELQSMRLTTSQVVAAVKARPFQGRLLKEWLANTEEGAARRVREGIVQGYTESQSIPEIVRRIKGTRAANYSDGILEINRRGAEAMVRTAITHTSSAAAEETYQEFAQIIVGVEWVATLDSRTSKTCAALDGQVFPVNSGPRPPAHINCRSTTIPRLKNMQGFERTTFAEWLEGQDVPVQDDVLGVKRARLWRSGGVKLDRFTDDNGRVLTLDQLRERDAGAFARAGLQ